MTDIFQERRLFGTDGIRGRANLHPMTGEIAMALGRAVTFYFQNKKVKKRPLVIIGKDTRLSCYMLEQAFASGVCSQGGVAILTGPLPTPGVAFVTKSMRADAGVMISASHNDFSDNGIKIFDATGHKLPDEVEYELEQYLTGMKLIQPKYDDDLGSAKRLDEVIGRYNVYVKTAFPSKYTLEGTRIVVDSANGACYKIAPMIFRELGAEVIELGNAPNGVNINRQCGALHPEDCAQNVIKYRADLGVCLDGDGDRVVIIDGTGEIIDGDKILGLCSKYLSETDQLDYKNEIVGTVMTNLGLEKYLNNLGLKLFRAKVGDRYIVERMIQSGSVFGGEPSGHIIFKNHSTTGDGILATLKVVEAMKYYEKSLLELVDEVKLYPQILKNIQVKEKVPFESNKNIVHLLDEIKMKLQGKGRILLRYSGTEPKARVMIEGENREEILAYCDEMVNLIKKELGQ